MSIAVHRPSSAKTSRALRMGDGLLSLHVCQGKYAHAEEHQDYPAAELHMEAIADLLTLSLKDLRGTMASHRSAR
jgi:hypothetical protein